MLVGWAIVVAPSAFPAAGARQHDPPAQSSRVRIVFATLQRLTRCCWLAGIKLGWAARWRKPGLRYPLAALASGCFHGYWSGAVGGAASSLVAAALGGACGHSGEGYVGLHTALLVIVAFFSVAMAARLHVRPATEALAAAPNANSRRCCLAGLPQDLPPTPGDGIIPTPAPSSDDGGEVRSGNEWAAHCFQQLWVAPLRCCWSAGGSGRDGRAARLLRRAAVLPMGALHAACLRNRSFLSGLKDGALSWRVRCAQERGMQFPWWLVVIAGMAGAISSLALHLDGQGSQKHEAGLMAATSRLVRAVPYLFYVPAPAQRGRY